MPVFDLWIWQKNKNFIPFHVDTDVLWFQVTQYPAVGRLLSKIPVPTHHGEKISIPAKYLKKNTWPFTKNYIVLLISNTLQIVTFVWMSGTN